jgi:hypothetical protein
MDLIRNKRENEMKNQKYFVFSILIGVLLMITLSIQTADAEDYQFIPANTAHIMNTIKELKYNPQLEIEIFGYAETFDNNLLEEVLKVREYYLDAGIDEIRITIGLGNKDGLMEEKFKFKKDGVYIRLCFD